MAGKASNTNLLIYSWGRIGIADPDWQLITIITVSH